MLVDILRTDAFFFTSTRINTFERGVPVVTTIVVADGAQIDLDAGVWNAYKYCCCWRVVIQIIRRDNHLLRAALNSK